jgi:hypothetical protein
VNTELGDEDGVCLFLLEWGGLVFQFIIAIKITTGPILVFTDFTTRKELEVLLLKMGVFIRNWITTVPLTRLLAQDIERWREE